MGNNCCQNRLRRLGLLSLDHHNRTAYPDAGCQGDQSILKKCPQKKMGWDEEGGVGGGEGQQLHVKITCSKPTFSALITTTVPLIQRQVVKVTRRCSLPADHTGLLTDQRTPTHRQTSFNFRSKARDTPVQKKSVVPMETHPNGKKSMVELTATSNKTCRKDN